MRKGTNRALFQGYCREIETFYSSPDITDGKVTQCRDENVLESLQILVSLASGIANVYEMPTSLKKKKKKKK